MTVAVTQVFGLTLPTDPNLAESLPVYPPRVETTGTTGGIAALAPTLPAGLANRTTQLKALLDPPSAAYIAAQVPLLEARGPLPGPAYYVDVPNDGRVYYKLSGQWFLSLTDTWTTAANTTAVAVNIGDASYTEGALAVLEVLDSAPENVVVVRASYRRALLSILHDRSLTSRIIGF